MNKKIFIILFLLSFFISIVNANTITISLSVTMPEIVKADLNEENLNSELEVEDTVVIVEERQLYGQPVIVKTILRK